MTYAPDWDIDLRDGEAAERLVLDLITDDQIEVKHDRKARETGNLFVEVYCQRRDGWHKSGLATTKATVWFFVLDEGEKLTVSISTKALKREVRRFYRGKLVSGGEDGSHPTLGVLVPLAAVLRHAKPVPS